LEAEAEAAADVDAPLARALVVVVGLAVALFAGAVTEATVVVPVVVPAAVVVPVPVVGAEVPEEVRQAVSVLDWTVNAADWARVPVLSRRFRPREVPTVMLTIHVSELPSC